MTSLNIGKSCSLASRALSSKILGLGIKARQRLDTSHTARERRGRFNVHQHINVSRSTIGTTFLTKFQVLQTNSNY